MRRLALVGLVAACSNEPGLLLDLHASSRDVVSIEVFLPDAEAGDGMGLPPGGAGAAKLPGAIYTVIDRVAATTAGGTATILLQRGDRTDVPALLVLGYNANHEPIASAVIRDKLELPASQTIELKVTLEPATYGFSGAGVHVARWSAAAPTGDTRGPCIAVLGGDKNAFFSVAGDLDCDAEQPDCDDTSYKYAGSGAPENAQCVSQQLYPQTMNACTVGSTLACTDGVGTCGPRVLGGNNETPICVPQTLCKHCPNTSSTTGTSGIDPTCEAAARMDQATIRIDCRLLATPSPTSGMVRPCFDTGTPLDLGQLAGQGWGCLGTPMYFFTNYGVVAPSMFLPVGGQPGMPDYRVDPHCAGGPLAFSFTASSGSAVGDVPDSDVLALFTFPMHAPSTAAAFAQLALPFRLSYAMTDACPTGPAMQCEIKTSSGDPADDPIWKGCAGAP
ncbi:MAG TPA: hypothetical protein VLT45_21505 [Kofleriaceae bacterium]|nr:hypothetical protein [Kofleriaceae bacterium]